MNFNELKALLHAEVAGRRSASSVPRVTGAQPLMKALGDVPNQMIKDAAVDSASRRRKVPNAGQLLGGGKRAYRVVHRGSSLTEAEARAACARAIRGSRLTADEAIRIEHCLNEHRTVPAALAAKLF